MSTSASTSVDCSGHSGCLKQCHSRHHLVVNVETSWTFLNVPERLKSNVICNLHFTLYNLADQGKGPFCEVLSYKKWTLINLCLYTYTGGVGSKTRLLFWNIGTLETDAKKYYWPRNKLLLKNSQFLSNLYETWWK